MSSPEWSYQPGNHYVICDVCGFKYRRSEMRLRWDNVWCCGQDWETRHPQDFVTAKTDVIVVTPQRPPPTNEFVFVCDLYTSSGVVGVGVIGCARVGIDMRNM